MFPILKEAVKAKVPLITVFTSDVVNVYEVLKAITGAEVEELPPVTNINSIKADKIYAGFIGEVMDDGSISKLYAKLVDMSSVLILINPKKPSSKVFNAGELPTPQDMIHKYLGLVADDPNQVANLANAVGGCTLREMAEITQIATGSTGELTVKSITAARREAFRGLQGLYPIDTDQPPYMPTEELIEYVVKEKPFFLNPPDPKLMPRGIMFNGPPGIGKSSGAKWLADQFGVAAYRLSVADARNRYIGDSEGNVRQALAALDQMEPCVVLIDEAEKVFGTTHNDGGTHQGMLTQLLWWFQEHKTRVFTVMTTNNIKIIPPELIRPGRLDRVIQLHGLTESGAKAFVGNLINEFKQNKDAYKPETITKIVASAMKIGGLGTKPPTTSHAAVRASFIDHLKSI